MYFVLCICLFKAKLDTVFLFLQTIYNIISLSVNKAGNVEFLEAYTSLRPKSFHHPDQKNPDYLHRVIPFASIPVISHSSQAFPGTALALPVVT